jgi:DNA polymerase III gamma/tau subunit
MNRIIEAENIKIDEDAKEYILRMSGNSIRNVINNLEKIFILNEHITLECCEKICSNISFQQFNDYILSFRENDLSKPIEILYKIHDYGYSVIDILDYFFSFVKLTDLLTETQKYKIIPVICKYITIFHNIHEDVIELALFTNDLFDILHEKK